MSDLVDQAIQSLRRIIENLRPSILDHLGLWAALEWQAQDFQARTGIPCLFEMEGDEPFVSPRPGHRHFPHLTGGADQYRPPCVGDSGQH